MTPTVHPRLINGPFDDPGLYLDFSFVARALLFDLGDLAALPPRLLLRVSHAFISHTHMDHFAGFDRLLRVRLGRSQPLHLVGPEGFADRVEHKLMAYSWNLVANYPGDFALTVTEVRGDAAPVGALFRCRDAFRRRLAAPALADGIVVAEDEFRVRAAVLDHGIPCLAFAFEETTHLNVWKDRLRRLGLPVGPWLRDLKQAVRRGDPDDAPFRAWWRAGGALQERRLPLGELKAEVLRIVPGQKIAYVVDAAYTEANAARIVELARGADHLFIEAVFLDADAEIAAHKRHLTAAQAGRLARLAGARRMIPFHFSPRYAGREDDLRREAEAAFAG